MTGIYLRFTMVRNEIIDLNNGIGSSIASVFRKMMELMEAKTKVRRDHESGEHENGKDDQYKQEAKNNSKGRH